MSLFGLKKESRLTRSAMPVTGREKSIWKHTALFSERRFL